MHFLPFPTYQFLKVKRKCQYFFITSFLLHLKKLLVYNVCVCLRFCSLASEDELFLWNNKNTKNCTVHSYYNDDDNTDNDKRQRLPVRIIHSYGRALKKKKDLVGKKLHTYNQVEIYCDKVKNVESQNPRKPPLQI